jgi:hypothetical protein
MHRRLGIAVLVAVIAAACGGVVDPSKNQIETFNGTAMTASANIGIHFFNIAKSGEVSITVTSLTPVVPTGTYFAVGIGQAVNGQCASAIQVNQFSTVGLAAISGPITPGTYCAFIFDEGLFTVDEAYELKVSHP